MRRDAGERSLRRGRVRAGGKAPRPERLVRTRPTWAIYGLVGYFAYLQAVLGPLMPFLRAERGFGYVLASLHFSTFAAGGVLVGILGDRVIRHLGRRASLWAGAFGMVAGAALLMVSPATAGTIVGALAMGAFGTFLLVTTQASLSEGYGDLSAAAITESNVVASACAIASSLAVGLFTASGLGWRAALVPPLAGLVLLALFFSAESFGRFQSAKASENGVASAAPHGSAGETRSSSRLPQLFWVYWAVVSLSVAAEWCVAYWGADFLENAVGLKRSDAATALSVFFGAMLIGRVSVSWLARRTAGTILLPATLCVALAGFPALWASPTPVLGLLGLFVFGLGIGSVYPLGIAVAAAAVPDRPDAATARLALASGGAVLSVPLVLGSLADRAGIGAAFGVIVLLLLAALALATVATRLSAGSMRRG